MESKTQNEIEAWREGTLSRICAGCEAYCCHLELYNLSEQQALLFASLRKQDHPMDATKDIAMLFEADEQETYSSLFFSRSGCPALKGKRCSIYANPLRPAVCRDFPVWPGEDRIFYYNSLCPATQVRNIGKLLLSLAKEGYRIMRLCGTRTKEPVSPEDLEYAIAEDYAAERLGIRISKWIIPQKQCG